MSSPNTLPRFGLTAVCTPVAVTAANTSSEGGGTVGTSNFLCVTGGANGTLVSKIRWQLTASVAGTGSTGTVGRIFYSTVGSGATTSANTFLIDEVNLPALTADSATVSLPSFDRPLDFEVPSGGFLLVTNHAAPAASTQWIAVPFAVSY
jgi:hypothetical protein